MKRFFRWLMELPLTADEYFDRYPDKHLFVSRRGGLSVNPEHLALLVRTGKCCQKERG